ncbi:MAG: FAD:protein FMN transferase [Aquiluna sp.]|nr:FAD:protein FMN transferase [Aquiluna sp.]MCF8545795.1 FAD:protein FMN transferase [Aquiluna sp.]
MGTTFVFQIEDEWSTAELEAICKNAMEILDDADLRFSLYKSDSEISRLNSRALSWDAASGVQKTIRDEASVWKERTNSFFDPVSPVGVYDPSGLVKSWAAQNAARYLEANGLRNFTLNAGGDIFLSKGLTSPLLFRVGLSNLTPIASESAGSNLILDLAKTDFRAVATSGSAERGEHIWRKQDSSFLQATVVAKDLVLADIWATALISGGDQALALFRERVSPADACAIAISEDLSISSSAGFAALLATL